MKRIIYALFLIVFLSCTPKGIKKEITTKQGEQKVETLEEISENNLQNAIEELIPQSPDFKPDISKKSIVFYDDSIYVTAFSMKYKNKFGGFSRDRFQYIVAVQDSATYRYLLTVSENEFSDFLMLFSNILNQPRNRDVLNDSIAQRHLLHKLGVSYCITYEGGVIER